MKLAWTQAATLAVLVLGASPLLASEYVALRFPPASEPAVYLRIDKDTLRVADSVKGLEGAKEVAPLQGQMEGLPKGTTGYSFPELTTSLRVSGFESVAITPRLYRMVLTATQRRRGRQIVSIPVQVRFVKRDAQGVPWSYVISAWAGDDASTDAKGVSADAESPTILNVQPPVGPQLKVQTKLLEKDRKAGIAIQLYQGSGQIFVARKGEAPAPVHLGVYDRAGRLVHSQDGDLPKFGYG